MRVDREEERENLIGRATEVIRSGGVVLHPTDTIYGLACDPFHEGALKRLLEIKERSPAKGLLLLLPSLGWIDHLSVDKPALFDRLAARFWPGPLTLLLKASPKLPSLLTGSSQKIGVRMPASSFLRHWLEELSIPLVSTSANLSGEEPPRAFSELEEIFSDRVDLMLEGEDFPQGQPSTVVDLTGHRAEMKRKGANGDKIEAFLEEPSD